MAPRVQQVHAERTVGGAPQTWAGGGGHHGEGRGGDHREVERNGKEWGTEDGDRSGWEDEPGYVPGILQQ